MGNYIIPLPLSSQQKELLHPPTANSFSMTLGSPSAGVHLLPILGAAELAGMQCHPPLPWVMAVVVGEMASSPHALLLLCLSRPAALLSLYRPSSHSFLPASQLIRDFKPLLLRVTGTP